MATWSLSSTLNRSNSWGEPTTPLLRITSFLYMLKGLCQENKGYMDPGSHSQQEQQLGEPTTPLLRIPSFLYMLKGLCHGPWVMESITPVLRM